MDLPLARLVGVVQRLEPAPTVQRPATVQMQVFVAHTALQPEAAAPTQPQGRVVRTTIQMARPGKQRLVIRPTTAIHVPVLAIQAIMEAHEAVALDRLRQRKRAQLRLQRAIVPPITEMQEPAPRARQVQQERQPQVHRPVSRPTLQAAQPIVPIHPVLPIHLPQAPVQVQVPALAPAVPTRVVMAVPAAAVVAAAVAVAAVVVAVHLVVVAGN